MMFADVVSLSIVILLFTQGYYLNSNQHYTNSNLTYVSKNNHIVLVII